MTRRDRLGLAAIVVLAAALRFPTLDVQSFWVDEAATAQLLDGSFGDMLDGVGDDESAPPLYYVLAWLWAQPFGVGETGLRSLSALFGVAAVPAVYAVGARLAGVRAGLVAALLAAVNPLLVWFGQEARAYALLVLLTALSLLALLRALEQPSGRRLALWAVVAAAALATHYFALFVLAGEAAWLLFALGPRRRRAALGTLAAPVAAGLALLPMALDQRAGDRAAFIREDSLSRRVAQVPKQWLAGYDAPSETALALIAGLLALIGVAGLWRLRGSLLTPIGLVGVTGVGRLRRNTLALLAALGASLLIPLLLVAVDNDYVITRNLLPSLVVALVLLALGFAAAGQRALPALGALAVLWTATSLSVQAGAEYQREDWRGAAEALGPPAVPRAVVVYPPGGRVAAEYYLPGARIARGERVQETAYLAVSERAGDDRVLVIPAVGLGPGERIVVERTTDTYSVLAKRTGPGPGRAATSPAGETVLFQPG